MNGLTSIPFAHRGLHDTNTPENSRPAFERAIAAGFGVELDVRLSRDDEAMVFHDARLTRMTGRSTFLRSLSRGELERTALAGGSVTIPSLEEVLGVLSGKVPLLVELKNEGLPGRLEESVARLLSRYDGACAVQSFNAASMLWFRRRAPGITRGLLAGSSPWRTWNPPRTMLRNLLLARAFVRPHFVAYNVDALPCGPAARARRDGLPVLAWTVDTPARRDTARRHADNVIFEGVAP